MVMERGDGVILSREASRRVAEYRDEFGQVVELDGVIEEVRDGCVLVRVLQVLEVPRNTRPVIGVRVWCGVEEVEPYEGVNLWNEAMVRRNLRRRAGEDVSEPRVSPFWAPL